MPKSTTPDAPARRALIEDIKDDRRGWLQHGAAALAVSLLGLGVAGSVVLTSNAEPAQVAVPSTRVAATTDPAVKLPAAFDRDATATSRDTAGRPALDQAKLQSLADQRAEELAKTDEQIEQAASTKAADAREKTLESASESTQEQAALIKKSADAKRAAELAQAAAPETTTTQKAAEPEAAAPAEAAPVNASGKSCMPVRGGYSIAARFGQVGSWSRYHTGFDFSAPVGTPLQAPASGVVTNAGSGPASGWAGNYVAIRYPDGTSSLQAHMSTVSVSVGQSVAACQTVGAVGMTGRTFGPHVHFEIYPAGITPGDVYKAVNPVSWLNAHGINP
ncbi:Murein DD-endopeptidase MepM and murein hydrolase activator NlpD, contain LysM domain [Friedmanniella luteola]|uniref:Murein DD-endopeptidase MepM and murein hydrolase activator NlpD, contain LysM domain n=1 Tax=Friedmanniella luteola TaxID=546871 RepID=A0A1H1YSE0_9ACTN|nr:M23 family metallopeptidase [Friedmanniella luteola]SDT24242.1 Murein DD-endopeptidase MepM and murein hydrolase activator NlpD, contain LysM domain [Friedmanniella luteola]